MNDLVIGGMPQERRTLNLGEYAEEAVLITEEQPAKQKRPLFIEANTVDATMEHLKNDCIIPVFAKDNEATLSHPAFIETVQDAASTFFQGEKIGLPDIRVSHVIKGRIPEAIHKPANQLLESDKTIYYERCAFAIEIPTVYETVNGNKLTLTVGGVRAYNHTNLYSKKGMERFKVFVGFTCMVCTNLCVSTDGYLSNLEVTNTKDLYRGVLEMLHGYNPAKHIHLMRSLGDTCMNDTSLPHYWVRCVCINVCHKAIKSGCHVCYLPIHRSMRLPKHISVMRTLAAWVVNYPCGNSIIC